MSEDLRTKEESGDEIFRSTLEGIRMEPAPRVWKKVNRTLLFHELIRFNFTNVPAVIWLLIPAAAVIIGTAIYLSLPGDEPVSLSQTSTAIKPAGDIPSSSQNGIPVRSDRPEPAGISPETTPVVTGQEPSAAVPEERAAMVTEQQHSHRENGTFRLSGIYSFAFPINPDEIAFPERIENLPLSPANPEPDQPQVGPSVSSINEGFGVGLNITPEMVFYKNPSNSFKYDYTFDVGAQYSLGRFFIQSGAGFTYSTGVGNYTVNYLKNDSVGFYYDVGSFVYDPQNPEQPIFQVKLITVYDSVEYVYDYSTRNRYYYLNIPLSVGYRIIDKPALRFSASVGMVYGWLLDAKEPTPSFYLPESRILNIESENPARTKHNLGLTGSLKLEYRFAKNLFLIVEPTFKYYLEMVEEKSAEGMKQPYSVGLRAGIWYQLDFKKGKK